MSCLFALGQPGLCNYGDSKEFPDATTHPLVGGYLHGKGGERKKEFQDRETMTLITRGKQESPFSASDRRHNRCLSALPYGGR